MRVSPAKPGQPYCIQQADGPRTLALTGRKAEPDVRRYCQVGEEAAFLRDVSDPAPLRRQIRTRSVHDSITDSDCSGVGSLAAHEDPQQRRLPAARWSGDPCEGSAGHTHAQVAEHDVAPEYLAQATDRKRRHAFILARWLTGQKTARARSWAPRPGRS